MMWYILFGLLILIVAGMVFLHIPYSPTSAQFQQVVAQNTKIAAPKAQFSEEDIKNLPLPVQRYFQHCGYLGKPKMLYMKAAMQDVDFVMSKKRTIKIDYTQLNLVERPERYALISSSLFGIPFEGLDSYANGTGSMKGVLAKGIRLFDQRGEKMNRACLATWLAECLMVPHAALQDFVQWEAIDATRAKATICWQGISASGVFCFAENGELLEFYTDDRAAIDMQGKETKARWSALFLDYHMVNGLLQPQVIQSIWHYTEGDLVYFNENRVPIHIQYQIKRHDYGYSGAQ